MAYNLLSGISQPDFIITFQYKDKNKGLYYSFCLASDQGGCVSA